MKKLMFLVLLMAGCSTSQKQVSITHDYVFDHAKRGCSTHSGLHYIVSIREIFEPGERETYPCTDRYKFRCQDGTLLDFDSGIAYCFIGEMQIEESLQK
jgi:hypothetical protein